MKMRVFIFRVEYVLAAFCLPAILLIVYYLSQESDPVEPSTNDFSKLLVKSPKLNIDVRTMMGKDYPLIIEHIQKHHLYQPSKDDYQLIRPNSSTISLLAKALKSVFNGKRNGIFVEAGAYDGEMFSNTLDFEENYNWTGLLIEPNSLMTQPLLNKHRKAWFIDVCISPVSFPKKVSMLQHKNGIDDTKSWYVLMGEVDKIELNDEKLIGIPWSDPVPSKNMSDCFPIFTILSAADIFDIDLFSLNVEGLELRIIWTIPFEKINIKVFLVEVSHIVEGHQALTTFMRSKGYQSPIDAGTANLIFIKNYYNAGNIQ